MNDFFTGLDVFSPLTIVTRLVFAMVAGFMIGYERETHNQAAGIRTHMVLCLGACLIMILSLAIPILFNRQHPNGDPARLSAQVISGIGFLGAGAIFRFGFDVKGLTTAASIWTTSAIGLAFGTGFYLLGSVSTVFLIVILKVFDRIEEWLVEKRKWRVLTVIFHSDMVSAHEIIKKAKEFDIEVKQVSLTENVEQKDTRVVINCRMEEDFSTRRLFDGIKSLGNIISLRID